MEGIIKFFAPDFIQELLVISILFVWRLPRRKPFYRRLLLSGCTIWLLVAYWCNELVGKAWMLFSNIREWTDSGNIVSFAIYSVLYLGAPLLAIYLFFRINSAISRKDALYGMTIVYIIQHIGYLVCDLVMGLDNQFKWWETILAWILYLLLTIPLSLWVIKNLNSERGYEVSVFRSLFLFAIVCILVLVLNWGIRIYVSGISRFFYNACLIYDLTCCVILLVVQVQQKREVSLQASVVAERRLREKMKEQYALSKENIDIINRKCHDLKHQISMLRGMADSPEKEEIIRSLEENVNIYDTRLETGNEALSVVLREKGLLCQENGIQWTCMVDGSLLDFMKTVDLYTLFGNALDNAIEACSKVEDGQKKVISVTVLRRVGIVTVEIENYYEGTLQEENDRLLTSKADKHLHGFGMESMRRTVESYGGSFQYEAKDHVFRLTMLFVGR